MRSLRVGDCVYVEGPVTSLKSTTYRRWAVVVEDLGHEVRVRWLRTGRDDGKVSKQKLHRGIATFVGPMSLKDGRLGVWQSDGSK